MTRIKIFILALVLIFQAQPARATDSDLDLYRDYVYDYGLRANQFFSSKEELEELSSLEEGGKDRLYDHIDLLDLGEDRPLLMIFWELVDQDGFKDLDLRLYRPLEEGFQELGLGKDLGQAYKVYQADNGLFLLKEGSNLEEPMVYSILAGPDSLELKEAPDLRDYYQNRGQLPEDFKDLAGPRDGRPSRRSFEILGRDLNYLALDEKYLEASFKDYSFKRIVLSGNEKLSLGPGQRKRIELDSNQQGLEYSYEVSEDGLVALEDGGWIRGLRPGRGQLLIGARKPGYREGFFKIDLEVLEPEKDERELPNFKLFSLAAVSSLLLALMIIIFKSKK